MLVVKRHIVLQASCTAFRRIALQGEGKRISRLTTDS